MKPYFASAVLHEANRLHKWAHQYYGWTVIARHGNYGMIELTATRFRDYDGNAVRRGDDKENYGYVVGKDFCVAAVDPADDTPLPVRLYEFTCKLMGHTERSSFWNDPNDPMMWAKLCKAMRKTQAAQAAEDEG